MSSPILTADGRMAVSIAVLARLIDCHRDQVREWRKRDQTCPTDLDLRAWYRWLYSTRRWTFAANLARASGLDLDQPAPAAAEAPAARSDAADAAMSEGDADLRFKRARALKAERELAELDGRLVERVLIERTAARLAAVVVERLQRGIWDALVPALDGATPDTRRACRDAHDRAILAMRAELGAGAVRAVLAEVLPAKERT